MLTEEKLKQLCLQGESNCVDYKRAQYSFSGAEDIKKAELLKDVLCFANAFRNTPAYILIGVDEDESGFGIILGINANEVIDDSRLQEFINSKTNNPIPFLAYSCKLNSGHIVQVIEVNACMGDRPFYLKNDFSKLRRNDVWVRAGTSSHIATPSEIAEMGKISIEIGNVPDIKTTLVSENGENGKLVSVSIASNVAKPAHKSISEIFGGSDYDNYMWIKTNIAKLHFTLESENVSRVNAEDLKYKFDLRCDDGCVVWNKEPLFSNSPHDSLQKQDGSTQGQVKNLRPKERDISAAELYLDVMHDGEFSIEVAVYGKNLPEPIVTLFRYSVSVANVLVHSETIRLLSIPLKRTTDVLHCMKWLVSQVNHLDSGADVSKIVLEYVMSRLHELGYL